MRYRTFGNTGREVSMVGLGGAQFGIYHTSVSRQEGGKVVRHAYDAGIDFFDTAPWYGYNSGHSEMTFAEGLKDVDRGSYFMATKVGRYENDVLKMFDFSAEKTSISVKASLERLNVGYIDLVQVHDFEYAEDIDVVLKETIPTLEHFRQNGIIKYIGLASYHLRKIKYLLDRSPVQIDSVQNHSCLTLIDQELRQYIDVFKSRGVGVINSSALAHGLLSERELPGFLEHANPDLVAASEKAVQMCKKNGFKIERLAYGYCARESEQLGVDVLLTGTASIKNLDDNIKTVEDGLTPEEYEFCNRLQRQVFDELKVRNWGDDDVAAYKRKLKEARAKIE